MDENYTVEQKNEADENDTGTGVSVLLKIVSIFGSLISLIGFFIVCAEISVWVGIASLFASAFLWLLMYASGTVIDILMETKKIQEDINRKLDGYIPTKEKSTDKQVEIVGESSESAIDRKQDKGQVFTKDDINDLPVI